MIETRSYESVLSTVSEWSLASRLALIRDLAQSLQVELKTHRRRKPTLQKALGLLAMDKPAPTDAKVERWLEEHRLEKYG